MTKQTLLMGQHVESTLKERIRRDGGVRAIMLCSEIAVMCGVTKVTARRYLNLLAEHNVVEVFDNQTRGALAYRYTGEV